MIDNKILRFIKLFILFMIVLYMTFEVYGLFSRSFKTVFIHIMIILILLLFLYVILNGFYRHLKNKKEKK